VVLNEPVEWVAPSKLDAAWAWVNISQCTGSASV